MNQTCCKDCVKRYLGCHGSCEEYKQFKHQREKANKKYREVNNSIEWNGYTKAMKKRRDRR